jgi:hypothetical protein
MTTKPKARKASIDGTAPLKTVAAALTVAGVGPCTIGDTKCP